MATTHLNRRLDALEQVFAATGGGCGHPWHGKVELFVIRASDPDPEIPRCPGCGAERPVLVSQLIIVPNAAGGNT